VVLSRSRIALAGLCLALLAGCASNRTLTTGSIPDYSAMPREQALGAVGQLGERYRANPNDRWVIVNYSAALRAQGQAGQAAAVLEAGLRAHPRDVEINTAYAKALTAEGRFEQALNVLDNVIRPDAPDWNALSVKGAVLDQLGRHAEARQLYLQAQVLAPHEPGIVANLGLSHLMTRELPQAERYLRQAAQMPGATSKVRQNLALVVGLQGRFSEAEALYARELPAEEVAANMAYVRAMLSQPNRWDSLTSSG
jgi:Flp pilus assembly protein TadD